MAEIFYYTRPNVGSPNGCAVMSAQFIKLDVHDWGHTFTRIAQTERVVKVCQSEEEAVELFKQLPKNNLKIG